jgi:hypothetical protein
VALGAAVAATVGDSADIMPGTEACPPGDSAADGRATDGWASDGWAAEGCAMTG